MKIVFLILTLFISINLFSEERSVDLNECINIALQNHPDFFSSIEDNKKSIASYRAVKSLSSIIINGTVTPVETVKTGGVSDVTDPHVPGKDTNIGLFTGFDFYYPIYDGKKEYQEEIAKTGIDISKIDSQRIRNDVFFGVKSAYYGYLLSINTLKIREEMNIKYKKKSDLAKQLFEQGSRPILDVSKAELDMADSQLRLEQAKNNERKTKLNLFQSMGLAEVETLNIKPKDVESIPDINCSLDELYRMAEIYSPVLRIVTLQKRSAKLKISQDDAAHLPVAGLNFRLGYTESKIYGAQKFSKNMESENWGPTFYGGVIASIPVYTGGRISAQVDNSTSDYNKILYYEKKLIIDIKNQVRDNYKSLEEIKKQLDLSTLITKNAQRHLLLAQRSYENGVGTLLELQDAELSVINAEIGFLSSKYGYLMTLAKLSSIIGIGESSICKNQE